MSSSSATHSTAEGSHGKGVHIAGSQHLRPEHGYERAADFRLLIPESSVFANE